MTTETGGALAAALAKAQGGFTKVTKDKTVRVTTKAGKEYTFKYAPLEVVLEATRKPLADNGLVVVQLLDDGDLVTILMHESGERLAGRVTLPGTEDIQGFGSAITYLRRYALQALLGIAAEDDDDGNHAAGNVAMPAKAAFEALADTGPDGLIGTVITQGTQDFLIRQSPEGSTLPFRLKNGNSSFICIAEGSLADALSMQNDVVGTRVTVWGHWSDESFAKGKGTVTFRVLHVERIKTPDWTLPAEGEAVAPGQVAAFDVEADLDTVAEKALA